MSIWTFRLVRKGLRESRRHFVFAPCLCRHAPERGECVHESARVCRSSSISIFYSLPDRGSVQGQRLKEDVSPMKACMSLAQRELCSAKERLHDPDLPVSEM